MPVIDIEEALDGYITCALGTGTVYGDVDTEDPDVPMDKNHGPDNLTALARLEMRRDVAEAIAVMDAAVGLEMYEDLRAVRDYTVSEAFGHDLWLTRNEHGVGFADRASNDPEAIVYFDKLDAVASALTSVGVDAHNGEVSYERGV